MSSEGKLIEWVIFGVLIVGLLGLDLTVFNRRAHKASLRASVFWSVFWTLLAFAFCGFVWYNHGSEKAMAFMAAYLVERALSVDNLFVFLAIFTFFRVPGKYQHRVLFWGILGALAMRLVFIVAGTALLQAFDWVKYVFGIFLIWTAWKLATSGESKIDPGKSPALKFASRYLRTSPDFHGPAFFVVQNGVRVATRLFVVLLVVEFTDVLFAFDSVPAVLAMSQDLFIVYTSNIFAILGLRALYFLIADLLERLAYLDIGLSVLLAFIGVKMMIVDLVHIPIGLSLWIVTGILALTVGISLLLGPKRRNGQPTVPAEVDPTPDE